VDTDAATGGHWLERLRQWYHNRFNRGESGRMKIIVGLGNPGQKYKNTRHNIGFRVVDLVAERLGVQFAREKFHGLIAEAKRGGQSVLLIKPMTYMNNSGLSVAQAARYKNAEPQDILVVVDDVNIALGKLRIRGSGRSGGHNGLKSIIDHLSSEQFPRLRLGVGLNRGTGELKDHVLGTFTPDEKIEVEAMVPRAADAVLCFLDDSIEETMNRFNG